MIDPTIGFPLDTPGLLNREIVKRDGDHFIIRETWDTNAVGCPFVIAHAVDDLEQYGLTPHGIVTAYGRKKRR